MSGFSDDSLPSGGSNYLNFEDSPAVAASLFSKTLVKKNAVADDRVPNSSTPTTILARPNSQRPLISTAAVAANNPLFPTKNKSQTVGRQQQNLKSENKSQRSMTSNVAAVSTPPLITQTPESQTRYVAEEIAGSQGSERAAKRNVEPGMARCFVSLIKVSDNQPFRDYMLEMLEAEDIEEYEEKFRDLLTTRFQRFCPQKK